MHLDAHVGLGVAEHQARRLAHHQRVGVAHTARLEVERLGAERYVAILLQVFRVDDEGKLRRDLTNDGLHLLGNGYLIWRDAILPYVK